MKTDFKFQTNFKFIESFKYEIQHLVLVGHWGKIVFGYHLVENSETFWKFETPWSIRIYLD